MGGRERTSKKESEWVRRERVKEGGGKSKISRLSDCVRDGGKE